MIEDLKELQSPELSSALLASAFKLFFKRAPETKRVLAQIFQQVMTNCYDVYVRQRAVMLYRMLSTNMQLAQQVAEE